jgi:hypothetical protein
MATSKNMKKTVAVKAETDTEAVVKETIETVEETVEKEIVVTTAPRKFAVDDLIPCTSITSGELLMIGERTKMLYRWADRGDVQDIEYQDLIYATRANSGFVFKPRFMIQDNDFLNQNPSVREKYETMYTINDFKDILDLPVSTMKKTIMELPDGAKESIKSMASTMISNGALDSVSKIKALDEIFNTNMMLITKLL